MVAGRTNCNRFFGKYELKGQELSFENLGMTRMACPDMQYEDAFVKMLDEVDSYEIKGSDLKFFDDKKVIAEFRAQPRPRSNSRTFPVRKTRFRQARRRVFAYSRYGVGGVVRKKAEICAVRPADCPFGIF